MKDLTTTDVAKLLCVSVRMVVRWCDDGWLRSYRVPLTKYRRIPRKYLVDFLVSHGRIDGATELFLRKCTETNGRQRKY